MISCKLRPLLACSQLEASVDAVSKRVVIPAKAGIHRQCKAWIPAFAGMTSGSGMPCGER